MLRLCFFAFLILAISLQGDSQNIVKNGAFQDTFAFTPTRPIIWRSPTNSTPDFYHPRQTDPNWLSPLNLAGFQYPQKGEGYYGFILYFSEKNETREYLQGELNRVLKKDSTYCFQMYISLADSSSYAIKNNMEIHFSTYKIDSNQIRNGLLHLNPQIEFIDSVHFVEKVAWIRLNGSFVANGGERQTV